MTGNKQPYVCPVQYSGSLDNFLRRWIHNPHKILSPYIRRGMTVMDLGCGPGYFTAEMALLAEKEGRVVAADLQKGMLEKMMKKIRGTDLVKQIEPHLCSKDSIGIRIKFDFVLAFWMIHEVPDQQHMFEELKSLLNPDGRILIVEPKIHVTKNKFKNMITMLESAGFVIIEKPQIALSRSIVVM